MFKRIKKKVKENETLKKLKELWKNPKTHDIAVLLFWLIFIIIVIVFARGISQTSKIQSPNTNNQNVTTFENIKSYDFTYKTNDLEINGQTYNEATVFYLNNKRYYYKNNIYQIEDNPVLINNYDPSVLKINTIFLNNLVSGITPLENQNYKQYLVPLDRFINLYEIDTNVDLSKAINYNIPVSVYTNENQINKVVLDLTNYYTLKTGVNTNYPVTINYYNVNNVSDFSKEYDKLVEVVKWQYNY